MFGLIGCSWCFIIIKSTAYCGEYQSTVYIKCYCDSYPGILQVFNVSSTVTIPHSSGQDSEAFSPDGVHN